MVEGDQALRIPEEPPSSHSSQEHKQRVAPDNDDRCLRDDCPRDEAPMDAAAVDEQAAEAALAVEV